MMASIPIRRLKLTRGLNKGDWYTEHLPSTVAAARSQVT